MEPPIILGIVVFVQRAGWYTGVTYGLLLKIIKMKTPIHQNEDTHKSWQFSLTLSRLEWSL